MTQIKKTRSKAINHEGHEEHEERKIKFSNPSYLRRQVFPKNL